ncbi:MAG: YceI family protein [Thermoanaerobaculia bacterium]
MKFRTLSTAALLFSAVSAFAATDTYVIDKSHSEANFKVRHLVSKVSGKFDDFAGKVTIDTAKPAASTVEFTIKTASVDTGSADRDKHLKAPDFFDADKYPEITFKSTKIVSRSKNKYQVTGDFSMHGVTKRLTLPVQFLGFAKDPWGNQRAGFSLNTRINRKDYGVNWNKALDNGGMLVSEEVDIEVNLETTKSKEDAK